MREFLRAFDMKPGSLIRKLGALACAWGVALSSLPAVAADKPSEPPNVYLGYLEVHIGAGVNV